MYAPRTYWGILPVHIFGGRHRKPQCSVQNILFLFSVGLQVVWWWLLLKWLHSWALSVKSCLSCFPQSRYNSLAFCTTVQLHLLHKLDTYEGVDHLGVFPLFLNVVVDIISPKLSIIFHGIISIGLNFGQSWIFQGTATNGDLCLINW